MAKDCRNCSKYRDYGDGKKGCNTKGFHDGKIVCLKFLDKEEARKAKARQYELRKRK